jgi:CBS domain-containing protein
MLELTHDINALPAVFIACIAAHGVTVLLMKRSILTEKVARRGYHLTREYAVNPLQLLRVRDVMEPSLVARGDGGSVVTYPDDLLETAMRKLLEHEAEVLPVASPDDPSNVVGYVERSAILGAWVQLTRDEHAREEGWLGRLKKAPP